MLGPQHSLSFGDGWALKTNTPSPKVMGGRTSSKTWLRRLSEVAFMGTRYRIASVTSKISSRSLQLGFIIPKLHVAHNVLITEIAALSPISSCILLN